MRVEELLGQWGTIKKLKTESCESTSRRNVILNWSRVEKAKMDRKRFKSHQDMGSEGEKEAKMTSSFQLIQVGWQKCHLLRRIKLIKSTLKKKIVWDVCVTSKWILEHPFEYMVLVFMWAWDWNLELIYL